MDPSPSPEALAQIRDALSRGQKIEAIKLYREHTGVGLKEAKDAVEALEKDPTLSLKLGSNAPAAASGPKGEKGCLGVLMVVLVVGLVVFW